MTMNNWQRLEDLLETITYRYAPERGVTAHYIAMCLDAHGVKAPPPKVATPCPTCGRLENIMCSNYYHHQDCIRCQNLEGLPKPEGRP